VKGFGINNVSAPVRDQWNRGDTEAWVHLVHAIEPNDDRDRSSPLARHKAFRSVYYETGKGRGVKPNQFLRESGFNRFPVVVPRWDVTAEDAYATDCPGMTALGDTKALQLAERRHAQMVDKEADPPLQGPSTIKNALDNGRVGAGDVIAVPTTGGGLSSIYDFKPNLVAVENKIEKIERRIDVAFYKPLFLMLAETDRRDITAREVAEKHEEKLLMLGPVLERLHTELLDPIIDRTFDLLQDNGVLPEPPEELRDRDLSVEYVSVLAQAQRLVATGAIDRLTQYTSAVSAVWPAARHKININKSVDEYAGALGV
ncbi:MAG: phage tail protein, partial [Gammaproteobacteria bacterium]|nr:phage tail protein [Gammaproteobacteria bacterium]